MPWAIKNQDGKFCVYKKTTGEIKHCYDNEGDAKKYLAALWANASEKELKDLESPLIISKEDDGRYHIVAVSTAALKDREGETFTTEAMDYDIGLATKSGEYPEFRVFHKKALAFGKVTKMRRVGIFAVDEGYSYDDPFSQAICEKMLVPNPGKWKCSRGFFIIETSGGCPSCGTPLLVGAKHMKIGFKCPRCNAAYLDYKGVLDDVHFRKAKTFDVTVTNIPAVPWTGVSAFRSDFTLEDNMTKKELKAKLLKEGLPEDAIDQRLEGMTDAQLKEFSDVPFAEILKEFEDADDDGEEAEILDLDEVVKEFKAVVRTVVKELLDGFEVNVTDIGDLEVDLKEVGDFTVLKENVAELTEKVDAMTSLMEKLLEKDDTRIKELVNDMPRAGKLRIKRFKAPAKGDDEDYDDEEDDSEDFDDEDVASKKHYEDDAGKIVDSEGNVVGSMTQFIAKALQN